MLENEEILRWRSQLSSKSKYREEVYWCSL